MSITKAELPKSRAAWGQYIADVRAFIESGWDCAEVDTEGRDPNVAQAGIVTMLKRKGIDGIKVISRKGRVYLVRRGA